MAQNVGAVCNGILCRHAPVSVSAYGKYVKERACSRHGRHLGVKTQRLLSQPSRRNDGCQRKKFCKH
ncbi:MAG: hypothetical protein J6C10_02185 [Prevotella sp.]|nr:hypothetical protein [Prevotella sp.]MBO5204589.1 hypothetical protein [Prevotella sp.]